MSKIDGSEGIGAAPLKEREPLFEIYTSSFDGSRIKRITRSKGYDSEPSFTPDGKRLLFTAIRRSQKALFLARPHGKRRAVLRSFRNNSNSTASFSPDGRSVMWVEESPKEGRRILIGNRFAKNPRALLTVKAQYESPSWTHDGEGIIFVSDLAERDNLDIYFFNLKSRCLSRLTHHPAKELDPFPAPKSRSIVFTSQRRERSQLFELTLPEKLPCEPLAL
jgi:Tol biopolymer transport system component